MEAIEPSGAVLGATIHGVDLSQDLDERTFGRLLLALGQHGVLRFPDQHLEEDGVRRFSQSFGDIQGPSSGPLTADGKGGRVAELYALYVRPACWSTGTGRALMDRVLTRTGAAGYQFITLWVLRDNERARRFYERAGFAPDGTSNVLERLGGVTELRYRRTLYR